MSDACVRPVCARCAPAGQDSPKKSQSCCFSCLKPKHRLVDRIGGAPGDCSQSRDVEGERSDPAKPVQAWPARGATAVGSQRTVCSRAASGLRFLSLTAPSLAAGPLGGAEV